MITTRGQAFLAAGATLVAGGLLLGFSDLTRVGVLLVLLPLITLLLAHRRPPTLSVRRTTTPTRLRLDERAEVQIEVRNLDSRRTPLLLAEERLDYVLGDRPRFVLPRMQPGESRLVRYHVRSHVRGRHLLGPITLRQRDPFGLTRAALLLRATTEVLVLPRIEHLGADRPRGEGVGSEGEIPHMVALHGEDDVSIRGYRDGDDLRRIHWPATAHRGELMVRQEDRPARRRAIILLDSRSSAFHPAGHGTGQAPGFEWAVSAAASVTVQLAGLGYAVHLVCAETVAEGSAAQLVDVDATLDVLAVAELASPSALEEGIRAAHGLTASGGVVIAVVADHDDDALRRLAAVRQPGSVGLAFVLDTASFRGIAGEETSPSAAAASELLGGAGWSTEVVRTGQTVRSAWSSLTARTAAGTATVTGAGR
ncbi:MAG TPA: DUF58 domain-containing protein [Segeticoccus sp.]|uniref:DUF58 domain-containing protein n=1 Tax=Segeticoccus sp. TaxID=2706531 RepID=UPI002D7EE926|nr:DUF58 domain-containing protein [Segeticoccus sp.]HET8601891.1 DUF58 domain-containing protein [Segeticoccus sp.]